MLVQFVVPSTKNQSIKISAREFNSRIRLVAGRFTELYGGATITRNQSGAWKNPAGNMVYENVATVGSYTDKPYRGEVLQFARVYRKVWGQYSIMLVFGTTPVFVE